MPTEGCTGAGEVGISQTVWWQQLNKNVLRCLFLNYVPINPLIAMLKPQSNGPSYSNTVIGTLAVDGWAVTFGTARRELGGSTARPGPSSLYQM